MLDLFLLTPDAV